MTLRFRRLNFLFGRRGAKLRPNISLKAWSGFTKVTSFDTIAALSATWFKSFEVHKRWANCKLLCFVCNPIPHFRNRFSRCSLENLFFTCWLSICLSRRSAFMLSLINYDEFFISKLSGVTWKSKNHQGPYALW